MKDWLQLYANGGYIGKEPVPEVMQDGGGIKMDSRNSINRTLSRLYTGYQETKPQLFKDFPILDIVQPVVSYLTGKSDVPPIFPVKATQWIPTKGNYYRIVGKDALEDAQKSGLIRTNYNSKPSPLDRPTKWPSFSKDTPSMEYAEMLSSKGTPHIIYETSRPMKASTMGRHGKGTTQFPINSEGNFIHEFPAKEVNVLYPNKFIGYSPIKTYQKGGKTDWLEDFKESSYVMWKRLVGPGKGKVGFEPVDMDDVLPRQGYRESNFLDKHVKGMNDAGAIGIAQIKQKTLQDYPELKGVNLRNPKQGVRAQALIMDDLMTASFIDKPYQPDSVTVAKGLGAYNWGRGSLSNYLNAQKKKGVDIYNSWDWLNGLPRETRNYINEVLRGKNPEFEKNFKSMRNHPYMKLYN